MRNCQRTSYQVMVARRSFDCDHATYLAKVPYLRSDSAPPNFQLRTSEEA